MKVLKMKSLLWFSSAFVLFAYTSIAKGSDYPPIDMNDPMTRELRNRGAFARMTDVEFVEYWHALVLRAEKGDSMPNTPLVMPADNSDHK